jgi:hypothetical protein
MPTSTSRLVWAGATALAGAIRGGCNQCSGAGCVAAYRVTSALFGVLLRIARMEYPSGNINLVLFTYPNFEYIFVVLEWHCGRLRGVVVLHAVSGVGGGCLHHLVAGTRASHGHCRRRW